MSTDTQAREAVFLAWTGSSLWGVYATHDGAVAALDDYLTRCHRDAEVVEDWALLTIDTSPVQTWARYYTSEMQGRPVTLDQRIDQRPVR